MGPEHLIRDGHLSPPSRRPVSGRLRRTVGRAAAVDDRLCPERGKVRDILACGDDLLICATDRVSAFDRVQTTIPWKGEVLTGLSLYHFERTADIVRNHVVRAVTARTLRVRRCRVLPVARARRARREEARRTGG